MPNITNLGRVGMVLRGEYSPSTSYERLDVVSYQKGAYCAKTAVSGVVPTNSTYWQTIVSMNDVSEDMYDSILAAQSAIDNANTAAETAVQIAQDAASAAESTANAAATNARTVTAEAATNANNAATNANNVADALSGISFDISSDMKLEVNIPWQS